MAQNISKNFSFIGKNIRKIRQAKKISQADFAQLFNLARPSVGAYEEGRSEPKIDTIIQIAKKFRISIDVLLTRELSVTEIFSFDKLNKKLDQVHQLKESGSLPSEKVSLVRTDRQIEYIVGHKNHDFIKSLENIGIPFSQLTETRAFEISGREMEYQQQGLHLGDILFADKISINKLKPLIGSVVIAVLPDQIAIRRLSDFSTSKIELKTDDPSYPTISIPSNDVLEIWHATHVYSNHLNAPSRMEERMLRLEEGLKRLDKK